MNFYHKDIVLRGRSECIYIYPISDIHFGASACDIEKLKQTVKQIQQLPNAFWFLLGDNIDAINRSDKRFTMESIYKPLFDMPGGLDNIVENQIKLLSRELYPIKDKCLFVMTGNHETTAKAHYHIDAGVRLAELLGVGCLGECVMFRLRFFRNAGKKSPSKIITVYANHGFGVGITSGASINKLERMAQAAGVEADLYFMGHTHKLIHEQIERITLSRTGELKLIARDKGFAVCGTYLKTFGKGYSTYAERAGYPPTRTGGLRVKIIPFNHITGVGSRIGGKNADDVLRFSIENLIYEE